MDAIFDNVMAINEKLNPAPFDLLPRWRCTVFHRSCLKATSSVWLMKSGHQVELLLASQGDWMRLRWHLMLMLLLLVEVVVMLDGQRAPVAVGAAGWRNGSRINRYQWLMLMMMMAAAAAPLVPLTSSSEGRMV